MNPSAFTDIGGGIIGILFFGVLAAVYYGVTRWLGYRRGDTVFHIALIVVAIFSVLQRLGTP